MSTLQNLRDAIADPAARALGEAAVDAGLITAEQLFECEKLGAPLRESLEKRCGLAPAVLDLLERFRGGLRSLGGRYELRGEIGRGATGVVYRAWDVELHRMVAVKLLHADLASNATMIARLKQEAVAIARLAHPNLLGLYDVGEVGGLPYLVLQLLEGPGLAEQIASRSLPVRKRVELIEKCARAVHHAHQHGIIHRDLKPGNIKIDADGEPHVLDFGLAHLGGAGAGLTQTGASLGTPSYMAPEQARGDDADARSDVYGLGATLYEALVGRPPFAAATLDELFMKIRLEEPAAPRRLDPSIPADLDLVVRKTLEKTRSRRYETAEAFADDLRRHLDGEPVLARAPGPISLAKRFVRRHKTMSSIAAVVAVTLIAVVARAEMHRSAVRSAEATARSLMVREAWAEAAAAWSTAIRLAPERSEFHSQKRVAEEVDVAVRAFARRGTPLDEQEAEQACLSAWALDPSVVEPRRILSVFYLERHEKARYARDAAALEFWRSRIIATGIAGAREKIEAKATVKVGSRPGGAVAHLFRYEERAKRLVPLPCDGEEVVEAALESVEPLARGSPVSPSAYPLPETAFNEVVFPLRLRPGSYVVVLRLEAASARFPFYIADASQRMEVEVQLARDLPAGFVYVPGGPFLMRSDPRALDFEHRPSNVAPFLIATFSTTCGEYLEFVNDRSFHSVEAAAKRVPAPWKRDGGRFVIAGMRAEDGVDGVSVQDAEAYATWRTAGSERWRYFLPSADQWEKAARGVDGRFFPWGDKIEPGFAATSESCAARGAGREPVGLFPADESPYGVRDLAGVVANWTRGDGQRAWGVIKGGSAKLTAVFSRSASRVNLATADVREGVGFRLAAEKK